MSCYFSPNKNLQSQFSAALCKWAKQVKVPRVSVQVNVALMWETIPIIKNGAVHTRCSSRVTSTSVSASELTKFSRYPASGLHAWLHKGQCAGRASSSFAITFGPPTNSLFTTCTNCTCNSELLQPPNGKKLSNK